MKSPESILSFRGVYYFLSNFEMAPVEWEGMTYPSSEHGFHAGKTLDPKLRKIIRDSGKPRDAKRLGRQIKLRSDWEKVKARIMYQVVYAKFEQHPELLGRLIDTGTATLVESNNHNDDYWGAVWLPVVRPILPSEKVWATNDNGQMLAGRNQLGKILMKIREELQ